MDLKSYKGNSFIGVATNVEIVMSDNTQYHFAILDYQRFSQLIKELNPMIIVLETQQNQPTKTAHLQPIPWRQVVKECFDTGLDFIYPIIKVIYTDDKAKRAVILHRPDETFTIAYQSLYPFNDDELKYFSVGLHGFWSPSEVDGYSVFDTEERAINEVFSDPPFKYNKSIVWANAPFRIDVENLHWIKDDSMDDPDDLCLHGDAIAKIGEEVFLYDSTVSAAGLYLLRTITENHLIHGDQAMFPCCGHWMMGNEDLSTVDIGGCPNGIDWSVIHEDGRVKIVTETGKEAFIELDIYREEVNVFADKIESFYKQSLPKNLSEKDIMSVNGYSTFWNEWHNRRD